MYGRVVGLRTGAGEMRPGEVPGSGVMAAAEISAGDVAATHDVAPTHEVAAAHGVTTAREVAPAREVAAAAGMATSSGMAASSGVALRTCQSRRTRYRNAEQQGSDGPYKCARSVHSQLPRCSSRGPRGSCSYQIRRLAGTSVQADAH